MNQQAKDRLSYFLVRTPEDRRPKMKVKMKDMEVAPEATTKCCYSCEEEGHLSRNCSKKRERLSTMVVEYEENEVRDLIALERPKRKKDH
jgi:recombinational DNA repair protein RecR